MQGMDVKSERWKGADERQCCFLPGNIISNLSLLNSIALLYMKEEQGISTFFLDSDKKYIYAVFMY
jgi:hypothetical protein